VELLTPDQVARIYAVTDSLYLDRNLVIIPLQAKADGLEMVMPDGKILVRGPTGPAFEGWITGLKERLQALDLGRSRR
jgi:hypothetical protein